jgi:mRNA-degrading endonuclease YafQ of YafQ-DinJ toxin-antitoxin module
MKKVITTSLFKRHYKERIEHDETLVEAFRDALITLRDDETQAKTHPLAGVMAHAESLEITADYRATYRMDQDHILLVDIGNHNQVYIRRKKTSRVKGKELL